MRRNYVTALASICVPLVAALAFAALAARDATAEAVLQANAQPTPAAGTLPAGVPSDWWSHVQAQLPAGEAAANTPSGVSDTPALTLTGEAPASWFGHLVATAGDVNGDGYSDLIVGAYGDADSQGRAFVYLGGPSGPSATPVLTLTGEAAANDFGYSSAAAGDVNGDGYADVIIGAWGYNSNQGRAYLYLGGASGLAATPALTLTGEAGNRFGDSVATAGDANGDGYADVIVGAYGYNGNQGRAYLYLGGASGLAATAALTLTGEAAGDYFGTSAATAGDVNGDGYTDIIVGALAYNSLQGRAYLYLGGVSGLAATPALTLTGEASNNRFGQSVATAGDVNGDGYADLIVGAWGYNGAQGRTYLYLGGAKGLSASAALTLTGEGGSEFGRSVATAGDVNGDGYADLIVGGRHFNNYQGRAYLYLGGASGLSASPVLTLTGEAPNNQFGLSAATVGDVDGDGYADVIVGAPAYNTFQGRAYLYLGGSSVPAETPVRTLSGEAVNPYLGSSVASAGDVNGDGYADLIVGAPWYNADQGRAYLYLGGAHGPFTTPALTLTGEAVNNQFGASVATAGDVNGDGYADLIVGAPWRDSGRGRAYLYLGGASRLYPTPALTLTGEAVSNQFGNSVAGAGDVNGDGYADVIVGASGFNTNQGRAYLFLGGASGLANSPALTLSGEAGNNSFGRSVASAGDINGDGYADLLVGAAGYNSNRGRAYLYVGGAGGPTATPALTLTGEAPASYFGRSVASAGDVNGDGYADLLVGADGYNNNQGRAYLYLGGASGPSATPALTTNGEMASDHFGVSVATAGDVNGDGYADLIVGASDYNSEQGRAYLFLGSAGGPAATAALTLTGEASNAGFGAAVATPGDLNGDGYADLIVGAPGYNSGQGRAYVYAANGGFGASVAPLMRRISGVTPIANGGRSDGPGAFNLRLRAASPFGRGMVGVEVEAKPLGVPFDGVRTVRLAATADSGATGATLTQLVGGLVPDTPYHWRARVLYNSVTTPFVQRSRWLTQPWNGWSEMRLRTAAGMRLFLPLIRR